MGFVDGVYALPMLGFAGFTALISTYTFIPSLKYELEGFPKTKLFIERGIPLYHRINPQP